MKIPVPTKIKRHQQEGGHWYSPTGELVTQVPSADGKKLVTTTLRQARKLGLFPSVTTILKSISSYGLVNWQIENGIKTAYMNPPMKDETEDNWLDRIIEESREITRHAAERGTEIHAAIEKYLESGKLPKDDVLKASCQGVKGLLDGSKYEVETPFCSKRLGWAGRADITTEHSVIDIKTVEMNKKSYSWPYFKHGLQLAAYAMGLNMHSARLINIYVCRLSGTCKAIEWGIDTRYAPEELKRAYGHLYEAWVIEKRFDPRKES